MKLEFVCGIEAQDASKKRNKNILIIGIVCLWVALVLGLAIGNKVSWVFIVPLIYLANSKKQISKKKTIIAVPIRMSVNQNDIEIVFVDTIRNNSGNFSEKFNFEIANIEKCSYIKKSRKLQILTKSQYYIVSDLSAEMGTTRIRNIAFQLPEEVETIVLSELSKIITIDYLR